jgi:cholesterol transport system auxiliary component
MILRVLFAAALLGGCSLLAPPQPEPEKAALTKLPDQIPHGARRAATVVVLPTEAGAAYDTTRMAYSERPYQLAYFRDHEWAEPPSGMIQKLLVRVLEQTGAFRSILTAPEAATSGYVLRSEILDLVQDDTRAPPVLRFALRLELRKTSGQAAASRDIRIEEPMRAATPAAGVFAANDALAKALQQAATIVLENAR